MKISPQHFKQIISEEITKYLREGKKEKKDYSIVDYGKPYKPPNHPDRTFHKRGQTSAGSYSEYSMQAARRLLMDPSVKSHLALDKLISNWPEGRGDEELKELLRDYIQDHIDEWPKYTKKHADYYEKDYLEGVPLPKQIKGLQVIKTRSETDRSDDPYDPNITTVYYKILDKENKEIGTAESDDHYGYVTGYLWGRPLPRDLNKGGGGMSKETFQRFFKTASGRKWLQRSFKGEDVGTAPAKDKDKLKLTIRENKR